MANKIKPVSPPLPDDPAYLAQLKRVIEKGKQHNATFKGRTQAYRAWVDRRLKEASEPLREVAGSYHTTVGRHDPTEGRPRLTGGTGGDVAFRQMPPGNTKPSQAPKQQGRVSRGKIPALRTEVHENIAGIIRCIIEAQQGPAVANASAKPNSVSAQSGGRSQAPAQQPSGATPGNPPKANTSASQDVTTSKASPPAQDTGSKPKVDPRGPVVGKVQDSNSPNAPAPVKSEFQKQQADRASGKSPAVPPGPGTNNPARQPATNNPMNQPASNNPMNQRQGHPQRGPSARNDHKR